MPPITKRTILEALDRATLRGLVERCDLFTTEFTMARHGYRAAASHLLELAEADRPYAPGEMIDYLMARRAFRADEVVRALTTDELRVLCEALGLSRRVPPPGGREEMLARITQEVGHARRQRRPGARAGEPLRGGVVGDA